MKEQFFDIPVEGQYCDTPMEKQCCDIPYGGAVMRNFCG